MINLNTDYCKWSKDKWSTSCYYINRIGMKKIYDKFYKNGKIDLSIKLYNYVADEGVIYNNLIIIIIIHIYTTVYNSYYIKTSMSI